MPPVLLPSPAVSEGEKQAIFYMKELPFVPVQYVQEATKVIANIASGTEVAQADSLSARLGKAMHRLLEWGSTSTGNMQACVREFMLTPAQGLEAAVMAQRILRGQGAWSWDKDTVAWQGNEVELVFQGQLLRLDRLVQRKDADNAGQWWVLDYKSAELPQNQAELVEKMHDYRAAVQAIYPQDVVRCAFLTAQGTLIEVL